MGRVCWDDIHENVIEWITGDDHIVCTLTQKKYINKARKIVEKQPYLKHWWHENKDGSVVCHLPLKVLKLSLIMPKERTFLDTSEKGVESDEVLSE